MVANPKATHEGPLQIGGWEYRCFVLQDGRRVILQKHLMDAIELRKGGKPTIDRLTSPFRYKEIHTSDLASLVHDLENPVEFRDLNGRKCLGYEGQTLIDYCGHLLRARRIGVLALPAERRYAAQAELIIAATAKIGIVSLIDEASGYQKVRKKDELQNLLDKFLSVEKARWAKTFPDQFYIELFRLRGWTWEGMQVNRPQCVGAYTNDIVYSRLAPGILEELQKLNPTNEDGYRDSRHTQYFTYDFGHPALRDRLQSIITLMRASKDWAMFRALLQRCFPRYGETEYMEFMSDE